MAYQRETKDSISKLIESLAKPTQSPRSEIARWEEEINDDEGISEENRSKLSELGEHLKGVIEGLTQKAKKYATKERAEGFITTVVSGLLVELIITLAMASFGIPPGAFGSLCDCAKVTAECACACV